MSNAWQIAGLDLQFLSKIEKFMLHCQVLLHIKKREKYLLEQELSKQKSIVFGQATKTLT